LLVVVEVLIIISDPLVVAVDIRMVPLEDL
jgi:hypothetical protein